MRNVLWAGLAMITVLAVAGCGAGARLTVRDGTGPDPVLPPPTRSLLPSVHIAKAVGWPPATTPIAATGLSVHAFARGLDHPRWLYVLPNGDVLVAESNAPDRPNDAKGIKGWVMKKVMARSGALTPSANRITLLRDADGDGVAETRSVLLHGLNSPFGMALVGDTLYVADTDALLRFPYVRGALSISVPGVNVVTLPGGPVNHHWTKNILASADGKVMYVTVGSNSNVAERGMALEAGRARILAVDLATATSRPFATGLRNPNGMAWQPQTGALWTVVNERDELGSDLVPDYLTSVRDGGFYGWPYSYYGQHVDTRVNPQNPTLVASALAPDYALGPHTASLGLAFYDADLLPSRYRDGAFIGQHGSWNRKPRSGYKVIHVPFANGVPAGPPSDVLSGFVDSDGNARGRPAGVAVDSRGALLVADDVGNVIWRVTPAGTPTSPSSTADPAVHVHH
ncbi:MAG: sorbosone dehydrogenase family protein [Rhodanobacter sp.]